MKIDFDGIRQMAQIAKEQGFTAFELFDLGNMLTGDVVLSLLDEIDRLKSSPLQQVVHEFVGEAVKGVAEAVRSQLESGSVAGEALAPVDPELVQLRKESESLRDQLANNITLLNRSESFVNFVIRCVRTNGDYSPASSQEMNELSRDLSAGIEQAIPTPYQAKGKWSFEYLENGNIVIRNGKDWTVVQCGNVPIYEQFLFRFCEAQMQERDQ